MRTRLARTTICGTSFDRFHSLHTNNRRELGALFPGIFGTVRFPRSGRLQASRSNNRREVGVLFPETCRTCKFPLGRFAGEDIRQGTREATCKTVRFSVNTPRARKHKRLVWFEYPEFPACLPFVCKIRDLFRLVGRKNALDVEGSRVVYDAARAFAAFLGRRGTTSKAPQPGERIYLPSGASNSEVRAHVGALGKNDEAVRSILPLFLVTRFCDAVRAFRTEHFAILTAFDPGRELHRDLEAQSRLVDAVKDYGLAWFPLISDWGHRPVRSIFIHCKHDRSEDAPHPFEPYLGLVTRFCRRHGLKPFIHGVCGNYVVFEGDPPLPSAVSDRLLIRVDVEFIKFRESQGCQVTQDPKVVKKNG